MYEEIDKQDSVESVLPAEGGNDTVSVDVLSDEVVQDVPVEDVPVEDVPVVDAPVEDVPAVDVPVVDAPVVDVSSGNAGDNFPVSTVLTGNGSGSVSESVEAVVCSCVQKPPLWESDISEYDTTDGLLLLILLFTILNTARGWFVK